MTERKFLQMRLEGLKKWRKEICEEFGNFPSFYSIQWFLDQMKQIDKRINEVKEALTPKTHNQ